MPAVGDHGLRIENVPADEFCDSHAEIRVQADASNPDASVVLILRGKVDIVVVVVMVVTTSSPGLGGRGHDSREPISSRVMTVRVVDGGDARKERLGYR